MNPHPTRHPFLGVILAVILIGLVGCHSSPDSAHADAGDLVDWVDPFIGTGGIPWSSAMLFPGATVPFGSVRLSPDTSYAGGFYLASNWATAGYYYGHNRTWGFSHTRLSGTGATDGAQFRITPALGGANPAQRLSTPPPPGQGERDRLPRVLRRPAG